MREVTIAKNAGFCFGVRRATEKVEKLLACRNGMGQYTCILGKLIHNPGSPIKTDAEHSLQHSDGGLILFNNKLTGFHKILI